MTESLPLWLSIQNPPPDGCKCWVLALCTDDEDNSDEQGDFVVTAATWDSGNQQWRDDDGSIHPTIEIQPAPNDPYKIYWTRIESLPSARVALDSFRWTHPSLV